MDSLFGVPVPDVIVDDATAAAADDESMVGVADDDADDDALPESSFWIAEDGAVKDEDDVAATGQVLPFVAVEGNFSLGRLDNAGSEGEEEEDGADVEDAWW